jgi:hypothetical protein
VLPHDTVNLKATTATNTGLGERQSNVNVEAEGMNAYKTPIIFCITMTLIEGDVLKRIQHMISKGWNTKMNARPTAKSMSTSLQKILHKLGGDPREQNDLRSDITLKHSFSTDENDVTLLRSQSLEY